MDFRKSIALITAIITLVFGLCACTASAEPDPDPVAAVGETLSMEKYDQTVTAIKEYTLLQKDGFLLEYRAEEGEVFLVLFIDITNTTSEQIGVMPTSAYTISVDGEELQHTIFDFSSWPIENVEYLDHELTRRGTTTKIEPGETLTGYLSVVAPEDWQVGELVRTDGAIVTFQKSDAT